MSINLTANFRPSIMISYDGTVSVDWDLSLVNVLDHDTQQLHEDPTSLPPEAEDLVNSVYKLLDKYGTAGFLELLAEELDDTPSDGWVLTDPPCRDQEIDLGSGWWAEVGPDGDRWTWQVWDQWTRSENVAALALGHAHTEAEAKRDALRSYSKLYVLRKQREAGV